MKKYSLCVVVATIFLVLCLPVSSLAYTGPNVVRTAVYGVAVGSGTSTASWIDADYNMTDSSHFAVKCDADTVGTRLRLRIYVDSDSISQFHLRISTGSAGPQVSQALQQSATWSYIYTYNPSTDSFAGGTNISDRCTLTQTANPSIWDFYYVGNSAISGNCIQVTLFTSSHNYTAGTWFHFSIDHFTVNGQNASELGPTETITEFDDTISGMVDQEEEWWTHIVAPGYEDKLHDTDVLREMQPYKAALGVAATGNFIVPSLIIACFTFAFYSYVLFGRKG